MIGGDKVKNKKVYIVVGVLLIALTAGLLIFTAPNDEKVPQNNANGNEQIAGTEQTAPSKVDQDEKEVSKKKQQELFNFIPKVYAEGIKPFTSAFMLDATMNKIIDVNDDFDFSVKNVDNMVQKLFGKDAKINKDEVSTPDVAKSLFYYSKEANSYAVIPVGYDGIFKYQIFKNATETDKAYYVYTYALIGGFSYDEDSIVQDEFGDMNYDNAKVQVIVGDKDGNDLVHIFDNYTFMYNEEIWLNKYSNIMPIFRYTLAKGDNGYYLTEVEQINY